PPRNPQKNENWAKTPTWTRVSCPTGTGRRRRTGCGRSSGRSGRPSRRKSK
ncbi:hypothetical protein HGM15179_022193, partial [Zosterops borbonicus]